MIPKFRAWYDETMHTDSVIVHDGKVFLDYRQFLDYEVIDGIELMQSAGLRDCKGKELFEGDIIEFDDTIWYKDDSYCSAKNLAVIKIKEGLALDLGDYKYGGEFSKDSTSALMYGLYEKDIDLKEFLSNPTNFKIVGNVHENKDLLEVKV